MAAGIRTNGVDLDDVFDPYVQGTKPALTGYRSAGQDLRDRYAPIVYGSAASATGYRIPGGADLSTLFAAKGTASYFPPAPWSGKAYQGAYAEPDINTSRTVKVSLEFLTTGVFNAYATEDQNGVKLLDSGRFLPVGSDSSDYEIICVLDSGDPLTLNEIPTYTRIIANKYVELQITGSPQIGKINSVTIVVRKIGNTNESFGSCTLAVDITN